MIVFSTVFAILIQLHYCSINYVNRKNTNINEDMIVALVIIVAAKHQDCPVFTVFLTIKASPKNILISLLQLSLKLQEHRSGYCREKFPWTILGKQFPPPRNTGASKIGNGVISLLRQQRCRCNPDHNKFSSLSFAAVVETFLETFVIGSLCSNLGGIDPETPYRAIFETKVGKNRTRHVKI